MPTSINTDSEKHNAVKNNDPTVNIYSLTFFDVNFTKAAEQYFKKLFTNWLIRSLFICERCEEKELHPRLKASELSPLSSNVLPAVLKRNF